MTIASNRFKAILCLVLVLSVWSWVPGRGASADDAVPSATAIVSTSEPTVPVATDSVPVATDTPITPATITRERFGAVASPTSLPTVGEGPAPTARLSTPEAPITQFTHVAVPATLLPTPLPASTSVPVAPLPSPAQLQQNARLRWGKRVPTSVRRWAFLIVPAARQYHLSPGLIAAVMTMESGGDPLAYSPADARGLMQVLHGPWDPRENVFTGARMLAEYHALFPDWALTLAAYNAGPNAVTAYNGVPPFRETRDYVIVVSYLWDLYSHRHLSVKRKVQYHTTLKDLQHFGRERAKVRRLAGIAHLHDATLGCTASKCARTQTSDLFSSLDPFWPLPGGEDPLQRVDPYAGSQ